MRYHFKLHGLFLVIMALRLLLEPPCLENMAIAGGREGHPLHSSTEATHGASDAVFIPGRGTGAVLEVRTGSQAPGATWGQRREAQHALDTMESPLVRSTSFGAVRGRVWEGTTLAWLGVPYAAPPIGALRWRAPRDPPPWKEPRDSFRFGNACIQYSGLLLTMNAETYGKPVGSEDCLTLNIWRPDSGAERLPVFFWIHGGLNAVGEGATSLYHGANLAREADVIVVTINYRLGILGWFAHESLRRHDAWDDSGNYGVLDIIKALRWVNANISAFGGDPENVTIAGESAGGFNVITLMGSPETRGLFHRAVSMSPLTSLSSISMEEAAERSNTQLQRILVRGGRAKSRREAQQLIREKGPSWVSTTLYSTSAEALLSGTVRLSDRGWNDIGLTVDAMGGGRFRDGSVVPLDFQTRFKRGDYHRVPLIIGSNADEGRIFEIALGLFTKPDAQELSALIRDFDPNRPQLKLESIVRPIFKPLYELVGSPIGRSVFEDTGVLPAAMCMSPHQSVFVYRFGWRAEPAPFDFLVGASHMMGVPFLFRNFHSDKDSLFRFAWSNDTHRERAALANTMTAYLSAFMRTGDPNAGEAQLPRWSPWESTDRRRLLLEREARMSH